jgi:hypothetical protein
MQGYCMAVIPPKIQKLMEKFGDSLMILHDGKNIMDSAG